MPAPDAAGGGAWRSPYLALVAAALFLRLVPLFADFLLGESVRLYHLAGLAFILSGIYIATAERPIWDRA